MHLYDNYKAAIMKIFFILLAFLHSSLQIKAHTPVLVLHTNAFEVLSLMMIRESFNLLKYMIILKCVCVCVYVQKHLYKSIHVYNMQGH